MPKASNEDCMVVIRSNGKVEVWQTGMKKFEAQAIQIPTPHGRLIDASELIKSYMKGTKTDIDDFYDTIDIIDNAPTILEAEE
jgi:hypothetical protein